MPEQSEFFTIPGNPEASGYLGVQSRELKADELSPGITSINSGQELRNVTDLFQASPEEIKLTSEQEIGNFGRNVVKFRNQQLERTIFLDEDIAA